jgi:membrane protein required for colicin V production
MSGLDWVIIGVVLLSVLLAAAQGFFYELFSLAGVVIGYLLAAWGYTRVAVWFSPLVKSAWVAEIAAFLTIFIAVVILAGILGRLARWFFKEAGLSWVDRLLGGAFGLVRGFLLIAVMLLALTTFAPGTQLLARSQFAPYALVVARAAVWVAPGQVRTRFYDGLNAVRQMRIAGLPLDSSGNRSGQKPAAATTK